MTQPTTTNHSSANHHDSLPEELLHVPGFIGRVMEHTLATAPCPNPVLALAGALALQSFLAGRKLRTDDGVRPDLYVLALGPTGCGKEHPRSVNARVLQAIGLDDCLGGGIASWQGLEDALYQAPAMLFQIDVIGWMLRSGALGNGRQRDILTSIATFHELSGSTVSMRPTATGKLRSIEQPSLTILGTDSAPDVYEALSEATAVLFGQVLVLETRGRCDSQPVVTGDVPRHLVETAAWWKAFCPEADGQPAPVIVEADAVAGDVFEHLREEIDAEGAAARSRGALERAVWNGTGTQARKLALVYAASENRASPVIGEAAAAWAAELALWNARRLVVAYRRQNNEIVAGAGPA